MGIERSVICRRNSASAVGVELDKKSTLVAAPRIFTENYCALRATDLADLAAPVAFMPILFETEHVDVKVERPADVTNEEHGARVPSLYLATAHRVFRHSRALVWKHSA